MKKLIAAVVVVGFLALSSGLMVAQEKGKVTLLSLLSERQKADFGLSKLGDDERRGLDTWATGMVVEAMQSTVDPADVEGAIILASDDEVLGKITSDKFDEKSLGNEFGTYGNPFGAKSLFNKFSKYADSFSSTSAFCPMATKPPQVLLKGKAVAYLTVNKTLRPRIDPYAVFGYCKYAR